MMPAPYSADLQIVLDISQKRSIAVFLESKISVFA